MTNQQIIKQIDFLASLDDRAVTEISEKFQEVTFPKGTVLFEENDPGDCFYVMKSGRVSLTKKISPEKETAGELFFFKPYDYFGELALIDEATRSGTATAVEDTSLLKICKDDFLYVCKDYPAVLFTIVRTMARRLRETNQRYIEIWDSLIREKKLAAIGTATSKIVHDIKTPMTIIILTAEVIGKVFDESNTFTEKIIKQVRIVDEMIKEVLEFARGRKSDLNIKRINLEEFFNEMLEQMNPLAELKGAELSVVNKVRQDVCFDPIKIQHAIFNIFKNGLEAMGGKKGKIEIKAGIEDERLHVSIINDGPPIPQHLLEKLFEPFVTYDKKTGTGLGLAICQKTIRDHNGDLIANNLGERGVQFDIYLPVKM